MKSTLVVGVLTWLVLAQATAQPLANGKDKFLGAATSSSLWSGFDSYWNQVTPGNDGKWGSVEGTRGQYNFGGLDIIYNYAIQHGIPFKEHTFVWGSQQPSWISTLDSANQRAAVESWIQHVAQRYPLMAYADVVNEPLHAPPSYKQALGGNGTTGWDWIITAFQLARQYCPPTTKLLLNEYSVLGSSTTTSQYLTIINLLKSRGLIDGIGIQGHYFEFRSHIGASSGPIYVWDTTTIKSNLNQLTATGIPVYITEFDIDEPIDSNQVSQYKMYFPILWRNPGVKGITLWGSYQSDVWSSYPNTYLIYTNGSERPAMQWLRSFLANGNYQSFQSGDWTDASTWARFDGTTWIHPAGHPPTTADGGVSILNGHTVTISSPDTTNKTIVAAGGTLLIAPGGSLTVFRGPTVQAGLTVSGSMSSQGALVTDTVTSLAFKGGTYHHIMDGGAVPLAQWLAGSTCAFDSIALSMPSNMKQDFWNIVWNCPMQSVPMSLNWDKVSIGGAITVQNTGTGRLSFSAPSSGHTDTVTLAGDVTVSGGTLAANSSDDGNTHVVVNHAGNIVVTGGELSISSGTQGGTGTTVWNLTKGNLSLSNAASQNATTTPDGAGFVFSRAGRQVLTLGAGASLSSLPIEVRGGTTLGAGTSVVSGEGHVVLSPGAILECGHPGGLDSLLQCSGSVSLSKGASYVFNGTTAQVTGSRLPDTVAGLTINNPVSVTLSHSGAVTGTATIQQGAFLLSGDSLMYGPNGTLTYNIGSTRTSTSAEFPATHGPANLTIVGSAGVTLHESRTLSGTLNLSTYGKLFLGTSTLTAGSVINTSRVYYIVTQGTGQLRLPAGAAGRLFPVGTKNGYTPVTVFNKGVADTTGVTVRDDSTANPRGGRVMLLWTMTSSDTSARNDSLRFDWPYALQNSAFTSNMAGNARIFHLGFGDTTEAGSGPYYAQISSTPFTLARGGVTSLGNFAIGAFQGITSAIAPAVTGEIPREFALHQNYPNPFNPTTTIAFALPQRSDVHLVLLNILGQTVRELATGPFEAGTYRVRLDATGLASGMYFYRIQAGSFVAVKKLLLLK